VNLLTWKRNGALPRAEPVEGLSDAERRLVIEGLQALRRERGRAWNIACDIAEQAGRKRPALAPYGIAEIEKLARRFGGTAPHWSDEEDQPPAPHDPS
jgi:hypothetical protein